MDQRIYGRFVPPNRHFNASTHQERDSEVRLFRRPQWPNNWARFSLTFMAAIPILAASWRPSQFNLLSTTQRSVCCGRKGPVRISDGQIDETPRPRCGKQCLITFSNSGLDQGDQEGGHMPWMSRAVRIQIWGPALEWLQN